MEGTTSPASHFWNGRAFGLPERARKNRGQLRKRRAFPVHRQGAESVSYPSIRPVQTGKDGYVGEAAFGIPQRLRNVLSYEQEITDFVAHHFDFAEFRFFKNFQHVHMNPLG